MAYFNFTDNLKTRLLAGELRTVQPGHPLVSLYAVLFICLSVCHGRLRFNTPLHLYLSPWQRSSRDTQLSSNSPPTAGPSRQTAVEEPRSLRYAWAALTAMLLSRAAVTSQAAWETAWWRLRSVLFCSTLALIPPTVRLNTKSFSLPVVTHHMACQPQKASAQGSLTT